MELIRSLFGGAGVVLWGLAGPITYIISVVDTWSARSSVLVKILVSLTLDAILAAIWPITWIIWLILHLAGNETPLRSVLGL